MILDKTITQLGWFSGFILAFLLSCSDVNNFTGNDRKSDNETPAGPELVDEPIMVGGAYLTCNFTTSEEVKQADGQYHVGCRIASRHSMRTLSLTRYESEWRLSDSQQNNIIPTIVYDNRQGSPSINDSSKYWHVVYGFKDTSFRSMNLDVRVKSNLHEVAFGKGLNQFNEDIDRDLNQMRLNQVMSSLALNFLPNNMNSTEQMQNDPTLEMLQALSQELSQINWSQQNTNRYKRNQDLNSHSYSPQSKYYYKQSKPTYSSGSAYNLFSGGNGWNVFGPENRAQGYANQAMSAIHADSCQPNNVNRYSAQSGSAVILEPTPTPVNFSHQSICLIDYVVAAERCAGVFVVHHTLSGVNVKMHLIQLRQANIPNQQAPSMDEILNTVNFHRCGS